MAGDPTASMRSLPPHDTSKPSQIRCRWPHSRSMKFGSVLICDIRLSVSPGVAQLTAQALCRNTISKSRFELRSGLSVPMENQESPSARNLCAGDEKSGGSLEKTWGKVVREFNAAAMPVQ